MLQKIDLGSESAMGFRWEGKFNEKGVKQSILQFLPELQSRAKMNVYLEIQEISDLEARALWDELKFDLKNFKQLTEKIDKIAVVTDESWLRNISEGSSFVLPGIKVKAFTMAEKQAGRTWVIS